MLRRKTANSPVSRIRYPAVGPMTKSFGNSRLLSVDASFMGVRKRKAAPYPFVLDALETLSPETRHMFGCLAVYVGDKIVLILREKAESVADNGVWLATTKEHHESLQGEFPSMRSIRGRGKKMTGWQVLPAEAPDFEQAAMRACELVINGDPRIGKVPASRRASTSRAKEKDISTKSAKAPKKAGRGRNTK
jgi:hypothetical protein